MARGDAVLNAKLQPPRPGAAQGQLQGGLACTNPIGAPAEHQGQRNGRRSCWGSRDALLLHAEQQQCRDPERQGAHFPMLCPLHGRLYGEGWQTIEPTAQEVQSSENPCDTGPAGTRQGPKCGAQARSAG